MASTHPLRKVISKISEARQRHEARHRPSGFGFALAEQIDALNPAHWDHAADQNRFFLRRSVLAAIEANGPANVSPRYALVYQGTEPVAAIAAQLVDVSGESVWQPAPSTSGKKVSLSRVLAPVARKLAARIEERALFAGNLMSWGFHGIAFAPGTDPKAIWPGVCEALYRIRRAEKLSGQTDLILVKDVTPAEAHAEALRTFSYRPVETEPNMVLTLSPAWKNHEDYLGALDAKYRRKARDLFKKIEAAGCVVETLSDLRPVADELHALYRSVQGKAAVKLVTLSPAFLPALATAAPNDFRCTVIRRDGRLLGFVTSLRDGDTAIGYYIGFDREAAAEGIPLYLRLLHATVADAIAWRCQRLSLGRTALEPKAGLGALPEPMAVWLRHRIPAMNWLLRGMLDAVPHEEAPERNPFKNV